MDRIESAIKMRNVSKRKLGPSYFFVGLTLVLLFVPFSSALADKISLQDGRIIEGRLSKLNTMILNPGVAPPNAPGATPIVMIDNDLCRTYVPFKFVTHADPAPAGQRLEEIDIDQPVATSGQRIGGVGAIINIQPWDENKNQGFGRRTFSMQGGTLGHIDVVQGITKLTPVWTRVEGLQLGKLTSYVWDMRLATTSIPPKELAAIIANQINSKRFEDRVKVVRFYLQMERYDDAKTELDHVIRDFPGREGLNDVVRELQQYRAEQRLREIEIRGKAGQHQLATAWLTKFPSDGVDGATLQKVRAKLDEYTEIDRKGTDTVNQLNALVEKIPDSGLRERVRPAVKEIADEMTANTLDRMATYNRFAADNQAPPENKLALAISGWLLGAGEAIEDLPRALSMVELRNLVRHYLQEIDQVRRDADLKKIMASEAVTPKFIAGLAAHMTPPIETEPPQTPGLYELSVGPNNGDPAVTYALQLPPEYDPHSSYPCIVTLHGGGSNPKQQIEWWSIQAARHGYIVIAPAWTKPHQGQYEGDLPRTRCRALNTAARLPAVCDRHRPRVFKRPFDGRRRGVGYRPVASRFVGRRDSDCRLGQQNRAAVQEKRGVGAVVFRLWRTGWRQNGEERIRVRRLHASQSRRRQRLHGRGIRRARPRTFFRRNSAAVRLDGCKQRNFFPKRFDVVTQRSFDNFFWWLEMRNFQPTPGKNFTPGSNLTGANGVAVRGAGGKPIVWLAPEMVDFSKPVNVSLNGQSMAPSKSIQPDIATMLEDIRTRGDRQHPFWAKVE